MRNMRRFLIDTDTASDDAVALMMALQSPDVRVEAITVVSGNVPLAQATENALYTVELCGRTDVPVFMGRTVRWCGSGHTPSGFMARTGLGIRTTRRRRCGRSRRMPLKQSSASFKRRPGSSW